MNSKLSEAVAKVRDLPEEQQEAIAELMLDFVAHPADYTILSPEQWAEVEASMRADEPYATPEEVEAFFAKFKA